MQETAAKSRFFDSEEEKQQLNKELMDFVDGKIENINTVAK
jgi:hypothetical protein